MLSRLWRWAVRQSPRAAPTASTVPEPRAATGAAPPRAPDGPLARAPAESATGLGAPDFFDLLAEQLGPPPLPAPADEQAISELVMMVVDYVTRKKVDPPVVPALVPRVLALVDEPEVDLVKLTHVIQQDQAISAKLLSVANSPLFTTGVEVKTVRQAISYLGTEQVAQVAIGLACKSSFESERSPFAVRWQRLFTHGMTCAFAAAQLSKPRGYAAQEAAFLGGLFHDVGKAVALRAVEALATSGRLPTVSEPVLDEALFRIHAFPGEEFYEKWTLPASLMELCARHHQLEEVESSDSTIFVVALASSFDTLLAGLPSEQRESLAEARVCAHKLGLSDASLRKAYAELRTLGERTRRMFSA